MSTNIYQTKVTSYNFGGDQEILAVDVPAELITDLDLHVNEVLEWEIDPINKTAKIVKKNIIIND